MARMSNSGLRNITSYQKVVAAAGTPERIMPYITATTLAFVEGGASADTITDSDSGFLSRGFYDGMKITTCGAGTAANNGNFTIDTVAAGTITLVTTDDVVDEAATASITIQPYGSGIPVPDGVSVIIKAASANTGTITVSDSSAKALNTSTFNIRLQANESLQVEVDDLKRLWFDATVNSEGVEVFFES